MITPSAINQYSTVFVLAPTDGLQQVRVKMIKAINGDAEISQLLTRNVVSGQEFDLATEPIILKEGDSLFGYFQLIELDPTSVGSLYCLNP